jgi:hypothetical protein
VIDLREFFFSKHADRLSAVTCARCGKATMYGKPFCTRHVMELPYARDVQRVWESGVSRLGDLLGFLTYEGPRTIDRLTRDLNLPYEEVAKLVSSLKKLGKVETSRTKRRSVFVRLV